MYSGTNVQIVYACMCVCVCVCVTHTQANAMKKPACCETNSDEDLKK